jgi:hypothetical protein
MMKRSPHFVYVTRDGRKTRARTKTSHSPRVREIDDGLLRQMARQCQLTKPDFLRLVDCPMNRDDYKGRLLGSEETAEAPGPGDPPGRR